MTDHTETQTDRPEDQLIPITTTQAFAALEALGLDPSKVSVIQMQPDWVFVTYSDGVQKRPIADQDANLGLASTSELIHELAARADVAQTIGAAWPNYRTVWTDTGSGPGYTESQIP